MRKRGFFALELVFLFASLALLGCPATAAFTSTPMTGAVSLTVQFTDQSTPGTAAIASWSWNFGDGGTSSWQHPSQTYVDAGTHSATLIVTSSAGSDGETKTAFITVTDGGEGEGEGEVDGEAGRHIIDLGIQSSNVTVAGMFSVARL